MAEAVTYLKLVGKDEASAVIDKVKTALSHVDGDAAQRLEIIAQKFSKIESGSGTLQQRLKGVQRLMQEMNFGGDSNTEMFAVLAERAAQYQDAISDATAATRLLADDIADLKVAGEVFTGIAAAGTMVTGVMGLLGKENDEVAQMLLKVQSAMAILNSVQTISNVLNKDSVLMLKLKQAAMQAQIATTAASTSATTANTAATLIATAKTKISTTVQTAWNVAKAIGAALLGNYTGLLLVAGAGLVTYAMSSDKAKSADERLSDAQEAANKSISKFEKTTKQTLPELEKRYITLRAEWNSLKKDSEKSDWIKKHRDDFEDLGISIKSAEDATKSFNTNYRSTQASVHTKATALQREQEMNTALSNSISQLVGKYLELQRTWNNLANSSQKTKFIKDNTIEFKNMGAAISSISDAEDFFSNGTTKFIEAISKRAKAMAQFEVLKNKWIEQIELVNQLGGQDKVDELMKNRPKNVQEAIQQNTTTNANVGVNANFSLDNPDDLKRFIQGDLTQQTDAIFDAQPIHPQINIQAQMPDFQRRNANLTKYAENLDYIQQLTEDLGNMQIADSYNTTVTEYDAGTIAAYSAALQKLRKERENHNQTESQVYVSLQKEYEILKKINELQRVYTTELDRANNLKEYVTIIEKQIALANKKIQINLQAGLDTTELQNQVETLEKEKYKTLFEIDLTSLSKLNIKEIISLLDKWKQLGMSNLNPTIRAEIQHHIDNITNSVNSTGTPQQALEVNKHQYDVAVKDFQKAVSDFENTFKNGDINADLPGMLTNVYSQLNNVNKLAGKAAQPQLQYVQYHSFGTEENNYQDKNIWSNIYENTTSGLNEFRQALKDAATDTTEWPQDLRQNLQDAVSEFGSAFDVLSMFNFNKFEDKTNPNVQKQSVLETVETVKQNVDSQVKLKTIGVDQAYSIINELNDILKDFGMEEYSVKVHIDTENGVQDLKGMSKTMYDIVGAAGPVGEAMNGIGQAFMSIAESGPAAKAGAVMAAVGTIVASFATAMMSASKNWITWLAFGVSGLATLTTMIMQLKGFASGGIVSSGKYVGDNNIVRVNGGEMILNGSQQRRLFDMLNSDGIGANSMMLNGKVEFDIQGSKLHGVLKNYNNKMAKVK